MADDSCYSVMLCFTDYIEFLYYVVGQVRFCGMLAPTIWEGSVLAICYIISGGLVKLLYNVIWGRGVLKIGIFVI